MPGESHADGDARVCGALGCTDPAAAVIDHPRHDIKFCPFCGGDLYVA